MLIFLKRPIRLVFRQCFKSEPTPVSPISVSDTSENKKPINDFSLHSCSVIFALSEYAGVLCTNDAEMCPLVYTVTSWGSKIV